MTSKRTALFLLGPLARVFLASLCFASAPMGLAQGRTDAAMPHGDVSSKPVGREGLLPIASSDSDAWFQLLGHDSFDVKQKFPDDVFLARLTGNQLEVINHFGLEAAAILMKYSESLYQLVVIEKRFKGASSLSKPFSLDRPSISSSDFEVMKKNSHFLRSLSNTSLRVIQAGGFNVFNTLNRFSNNLEDALISLIKAGEVSEKEAQYVRSELKNVSWFRPDSFSEVDVAVRERVENARIDEGYGNFKEAVEAWLQLLSWSEHSYGISHESVSICLDKIAYLYSAQALYGKAETYYERLIKIRKTVNGKDSDEYLSAISSAGRMYFQMALYPKAESLLLEAYQAYVKKYGEKSDKLASLAVELAGFYSIKNNDKRARELYALSYELRKKFWGEPSMELGDVYFEFARHLIRQGQYEEAEKYIFMSYKNYAGVSFGYEPYFAHVNFQLSKVFVNTGRMADAAELLEASLQSFERLSPDRLAVLNELSKLLVSIDDLPNAYQRIREGIGDSSSLIQREVPLLPLHLRRAFVAGVGDVNSVALALAKVDSSGAKLAMFSRLNHHGLLEQIEKAQAKLASLPGEQLQVSQNLRSIRHQLSSLSIQPAQRQSLKVQQEALEKELYRLLPELKPTLVEVNQVANALPEKGVLIEFQRYQPFDAKKPQGDRWGRARYMAMVLNPNGSVTVIELGDAAVLDQAITAAVSTARQAQEDAVQKFDLVSQLLLEPLQQATAGAKTWFVSPDGELNRLPFAALQVPGGKGYLAEAVDLRLLTTGRELLDLQQPKPSAKSAALVVADPAYDRNGDGASKPLPAEDRGESRDEHQRSSDLPEQLKWNRLPATAKEGEFVKTITGGSLLVQKQATAKAVKDTPAPKILHLATHAFYLPNQPQRQPESGARLLDQRGSRGVVQASSLQGESPLLRSGIALAGANQPNADPKDDGYLTALEVAQLSWEGTDLVVISACESGLGDLQVGEGVYGLKRAIAVAGARSSLLSLWKVDDHATKAFMEGFYARLKEGKGKAQALAETQKEFRESPPMPRYEHPYYWAAFQLSGDWGPVKGL